MNDSLKVFAASAILAFVAMAPARSEAAYRALYGYNAKIDSNGSWTGCARLPVQTADNFLKTSITYVEADIDVSADVHAKTCNRSWNSTSLTCGSFTTTVTATGPTQLSPSVSNLFSITSQYDYPFVYVETTSSSFSPLGAFMSY